MAELNQPSPEVVAKVRDLLANRDALEEERRVLKDRIESLTREAANLLGKPEVGSKHRFPDGATIEVKWSKGRTKWQNDDLLRVVLDSRLVDPETGEIAEENALDRIKAVYPLGGSTARTTALRARGIDPDEFCESGIWKPSVKVL